MIQDIIAYLIISVAFGALALNILQFFNLVGKKSGNTTKCSGCSGGCEIKEIQQFKKDKPTNYNQFRMQL
ncbi:hypothetical protein AQPE_4568 [Aquipluma nitroreducens]|uniref:FeoB-associated Cys-rich membrane protein n=1 Tax=Aquipluma nitroreducens TaxID=2010828 RepID=A0A5K7SG13_9BACT|nr:hypothetical protein AQPE_4568 [Aquipluma nitroreducens]